MYVLMIGTAGSGKTALTAAYTKWLRDNGYDVTAVNLDPGAEVLPYEPSFDVRKLFTIRDIMVKYGLGPNGAFLKASELLLSTIDDILRDSSFDETHDFVIIDTPGQMEIFVFREAGPAIAAKLKEKGPTLAVYIVDGQLVRSVADVVLTWFMGLVVQMRLDVPVIPIVNKADLLSTEEVEEVVRAIVEDPEKLRERIIGEEIGLQGDVAEALLDLSVRLGRATRLVLVSAKTGKGIEELHYLVHEAFCTCGDLT